MLKTSPIELKYFSKMFREALKRKYENVYICKRCGAKVRTKKPTKTKCPKCGSRKLRPKAKERRSKT